MKALMEGKIDEYDRSKKRKRGRPKTRAELRLPAVQAAPGRRRNRW